MGKVRLRVKHRYVFVGVFVLLIGAGGAVVWRDLPFLAKTHFTIYVLGASTARGDPYDFAGLDRWVNFGHLVAYAFDGEILGRKTRVVNLARGGIPAQRVAELAEDVSSRADVVLLYAGNNQFLTHDDDTDRAGFNRRLFEEPTTTSEERALELQNYEVAIEGVIKRLKKRGIPLIISSVVSNLSDWEPNRSVLDNTTNEARVRHLLGEGDRYLAGGHLAQASAAYEAIISLEPHFALAHMRLADIYRLQGDTEKARIHYQRAVDLDGNPYRVFSTQNSFLKRVSTHNGVPFVDAVEILQQAADDGLIGFNLIWDHCHPTLQGYALIADGFAQKLNEALALGRELKPLDPDVVRQAFSVDNHRRLHVFASRGRVCYGSAVLTFDPTRRLACAEEYLRQAGAIDDESLDYLGNMAVLHVLKGDLPSVRKYSTKAYVLDAEYAEERLKHPLVGKYLKRLGVRDPLTLLE